MALDPALRRLLGASFCEAIISDTSFWSFSDQWNFFRNADASPPRSAKSALRNFCSGVVGYAQSMSAGSLAAHASVYSGSFTSTIGTSLNSHCGWYQ